MSQMNDYINRYDIPTKEKNEKSYKKRKLESEELKLDISTIIHSFNLFESMLPKQNSEINEASKGLSNIFIVEFLEFINKNPELSISMLLWIDTFHDFTRTRAFKGGDESESIIPSINNILDFYLRNKVRPWSINEYPVSTKKLETTHYSISKCFRDSFFDYNTYNDYNDKGKLNDYPYQRKDINMAFYPFNEDVENTLLKTCYEWDINNNEKCSDDKLKHKCARILYQMSLITYDEANPFEQELLYSYILYNFFRDTNSNTISTKTIYKKLQKSVFTCISDLFGEYYAKDVDVKKTSSSIEGQNLVILPSSLFDKNKANSSNNFKNFANIEKTTIPFVAFDNFVYDYSYDDCSLKVTTPFSNKQLIFQSSCTNINIDSYDSYDRYNTVDVKNALLKMSRHINYKDNSFKIINNSEITKQEELIDSIITFVNNAKEFIINNIPIVQDGFSVSEINIRLLCEIISEVQKSINKEEINIWQLLKPSQFDIYMSLKRVGDFGQILQCKQLGIPLITDDNMQILISIACCSSVIWTPSDRLLYYDGNNDCFVNYYKNIFLEKYCSVPRTTIYNYKDSIDKILLFNNTNKIDNKQEILQKVTSLYKSYYINDRTINIPKSFETTYKEQKERKQKIQIEEKERKEEEEQKMQIEIEQKNQQEQEIKCSIKKYADSNEINFKKNIITMVNKLKSYDKIPTQFTMNNDVDIDEILKENINCDKNIISLKDWHDEVEQIKLNEPRSTGKRIKSYNQNYRIKSKYRITQKKKANKYRKNK